ncbi:10044_t:CDS:2, partial [Racocetra fulgida]
GGRPNENFVNLQRDIRLPGTPRPIKPVEDNIDRTPEYKAFMKSLEEFHRAHGKYHEVEDRHQNRILLALKSHLPNEVDWAFEILVQLSADEIINFHVDKIPGLVDTILLFVSPFYKDLRKLTGHDSVCMSVMDYCKDIDNIEATINEFLSSPTKVEQVKRIMQIFLMFRNLSFTEHNVKFMAGYKPLRRFLIESLVLPEVARLSELKHHCLETVANMCRVITLRSSKDELLSTLPKLLYSKDSALVLLSIRAMASLAANEHNADFLREIDPTIVQRLVQLLLIEDDEELILAVLDWFYQYSTYEDSAYTIAQNAPGNFVRLLINFLRYGANEEDYIYDQRTPMELHPFQIHGEFEDYPEPYRTLEW